MKRKLQDEMVLATFIEQPIKETGICLPMGFPNLYGMASKDLHQKPFDESTLSKLLIFKEYLKEWLPTFIMQPHITEVNIFDLFAGPGKDKNNQEGSPIIILKIINEFFLILQKKPTKINVYLNEFKRNKYNLLKNNCEEYLIQNRHLNSFVNVHYSRKDFSTIYPECLELMKGKPNLVFLDQNGVRFVSEGNFKKLISLEKTDFLYFISSSYFRRFGQDEAFLNHLNVNYDEIITNPYRFIHRIILNHYKKLIPKTNPVMLFPFSLKKGGNIHGLIFGATNLRAVDKFLRVVWKINPINGDSNFDIDEDLKKTQGELFGEYKKPTKIEAFQVELENKIADHTLKNNLEVFKYTLSKGHIPEHATDIVRKLKNHKINYTGHPLISYDAYQRNTMVEYKPLT